MALTPPTHRQEYTASAGLDRIQANVRGLVAYVKSLTWVTQREYAELSADTIIAAAAYVDLISATISTTDRQGFLVVSFTASGVKTTGAGDVYFMVLVDNVAVKGVHVTLAASDAFSAAIVARTAVVAGSHTVTVQWKTGVSSAAIYAVSTAEEHAAMTVQAEAA